MLEQIVSNAKPIMEKGFERFKEEITDGEYQCS